MVIAAVLRDCCSNPGELKPKCHSKPLSKPKKQEQKRRAAEWSVWTSSIAADIDLASDWWFLEDVLDKQSLSDDLKTQLLLGFTIAGTFTWILEVFVTVAIQRAPDRQKWDYVPFLVMIVEDIPQIVLTWLISGSFANISGRAVFNITTSVYSLIITLVGELFLNCNWCCEVRKDEDGEDGQEEVVIDGDGAGFKDEERGGSSSGIAHSSVVRRKK